MKLLATLLMAGFLTVGTAYAADAKKEEPKKEPEVKTVCLDVQGKDGKPVIDPKTNKPKQNCTKVKVREKFEGTKIEDAKKEQVMKAIAAVFLAVSLTGCSTIQGWVPSFWDDNQSRAIIDVRQSVVQLNCDEPHAPQVKKIKDQLQWFDLYSESKGKRQQDVRKLIAPMQETVDDFYKRSTEKQGTKTYCEIKKKVMTTQIDKASSAVLGRF